MIYTINKLTPALECEYDNFIRSSEGALFFASLGYRNLLRKFLGQNAEDYYYIAQDETGDIKGVLPSFVLSVDGFGPIVNSLPFYGSHGGVIVRPDCGFLLPVLLDHFREQTERLGCSSATVITSPFENDLASYENYLRHTHKDSRIGQFTRLPKKDENIQITLMSFLHQKNRNMVRKAIKENIKVTSNLWDGAIDFLAETHLENMKVIGGKGKPHSFFNAISSSLSYGADFKIYTAWSAEKPIAALLLFYFNNVVEYFTPVILNEYRSHQPMSLIIFEAMVDAINTGYQLWNWGGTWHTQEGVYKFKRSWGAEEKPYYYFIRVIDNNLLFQSKDWLEKSTPYFYSFPFDVL